MHLGGLPGDSIIPNSRQLTHPTLKEQIKEKKVLTPGSIPIIPLRHIIRTIRETQAVVAASVPAVSVRVADRGGGVYVSFCVEARF